MTHIRVTEKEAQEAVSIIYDIADQAFHNGNTAHQIVLTTGITKRIKDWHNNFIVGEKHD